MMQNLLQFRLLKYIVLILLIKIIHGKRIFKTPEDYEKEDPANTLDRKKFYDKYVSKCEYDAVHYGTTLVDLINAPKNSHDTPSRIFQDEIIENLGFAPWIMNVPNHATTNTGTSVKELQERGGWYNRPIENSSYAGLMNKWIYMYGDSTSRQLWAAYSVPSKGRDFEKHAKQYTRDNCRPQAPHRHKHERKGNFENEGWSGSCGLNEVTCDAPGYGGNGFLTFDWKHFPWEDYDEYLFSNENGPFRAGFVNHPGAPFIRPTVFTIQYALHTCYHFYDNWLKEPKVSFAEKHREDVWKMMSKIREAVDAMPTGTTREQGSGGQPPVTYVILMTSGVVNAGPTFAQADVCIQIMNRLTMDAAYAFGFVVLDRGEIERRFMSKSLYYEKNPLFPTDMHLIQPSAHIISTALLQMINCISHYQISHSEFHLDQSPLGKLPRDIPTGYRNWQEHYSSIV
jgi:hypothetical protein